MADFHVFADPDDLAKEGARLIASLAQRALELRGRFVVALSGGSTPERLYRALTGEPYRSNIPWDRMVVFWGDDRAVPPDHAWSNYKLAHDLLLAHVPVPADHIHRIQGELGAREAARAMEQDLADVFGSQGMPRFDLVIQGMGRDGHTASLFPGSGTLEADGWVVPVIAPPADPAVDRVTLTLPVLNAARYALVMVTGTSKRSIIHEIMTDPTAMERYPAACLEAETTRWYVDQAAFGD